MGRPSIALALFIIAPTALAQMQTPNLGELKVRNAVQLSTEELRQLIPGAKVVSYTNAGSTRRWTNKADGTLVASSDGRGSTGGRGYTSSGQGTWTLDEKGRWCATINWNNLKEDWCRYLFKADGKYYAYGRLQDDTPGSTFEISR